MTRSLSQAELDELAGLLSEHGGIMPSALTGFLTACLSAGDEPSKWIPDLYEGDDPRAIELMERLARELHRDLSRGRFTWPTAREEQRIWCSGYMHYARDSTVFSAMAGEKAFAELLFPIAAGSELEAPGGVVVELLAKVPANAAYLYRILELSRQSKPKTGRNDPCPCGSGKKYKRCCLN